MNQNENKEIFFNRAEIKNAQHICCENCFENVVFMLKDKDHEFSMGLSTVLECLRFAQDNGDIPPIDEKWWIDVRKHFGDV